MVGEKSQVDDRVFHQEGGSNEGNQSQEAEAKTRDNVVRIPALPLPLGQSN